MSVVKVSLLTGFKLNTHKRRSDKLKRHVTDCGVYFIQRLLFLAKLIFKVVLNLGLEIGRQQHSPGRTENPSKVEKFKRSQRTDCGFSIST